MDLDENNVDEDELGVPEVVDDSQGDSSDDDEYIEDLDASDINIFQV